MLDLTWDYPVHGPLAEPSAEAVLAEINGWDAEGKPLSGFAQLKDDGSTACGCWIYSGAYAGGVNQTARRKPGSEQSWVAPEWGWAWPANRRILYNRASADPDGKPWSERKAYVWWDAEAGKWTGHDVPDFPATRPPSYRPPPGRDRGRRDLRDRRVHHAERRQGLAVRPGRAGRRAAAHALRAAGVAVRQPAVRPAAQPDQGDHQAQGEPAAAQRHRAGLVGVPLRGHHLPADRAPHRGRHVPHPALPVRAAAGVLLRGVAGTGRRAGPGAHGLGHDHHRPDRGRGAGAGHRRGCAP